MKCVLDQKPLHFRGSLQKEVTGGVGLVPRLLNGVYSGVGCRKLLTNMDIRIYEGLRTRVV